MEHYFICICNEITIAEEQNFIVSYINSLVSTPESLSYLYCDIIPVPLLKCNSIYLSVISSSFKADEVATWTKVNGEVNLKPWISAYKQETEDPHIDENIRMDEHILSSYLNNLADQLPSCGSYKLDLIISYEILKNFSVKKHIELAGSLYRLFRWHMAHTSIILLEEADRSNITEWCEIIDAEFFDGKIDPLLGPVVWRGSFQFNLQNLSTNSYPGFQLRLDPLENEFIFKDTSDIEESQSEHLIVSPVLRVIDECSFASIPVYLFLPLTFKVYLCEQNMFNRTSMRLLDYLNQKNGAAFIVRLGYSLLSEKPKPDKSLNTSKWRKMVSSANIKCPDSCFPVVEKYLTFVVTTSPKSGHVVAHFLRDPSSLDANFYFNATNAMQSVSRQLGGADETSEDSDIAEIKFPYLPEHSFQSLVNKINVSDLNTKQECLVKQDALNFGNCCLSSLLDCVANSLTCFSMQSNKNASNVSKEEIDPSDWPERVHLLQKQIQSEKENKNDRPNVFLNLSPHRSQCNISFTSQDAEKYFKPSGEAKNDENAEPLSTVNNNEKGVKQDLDELLKSKWPEVLKCSHDDVYYNANKQAEDKELIGNEMARFYVQHETASTCNRQQVKMDHIIVVRTKTKAPKQKWRSPATPRSFVRRKQTRHKHEDKTETSASLATSKTTPTTDRFRKSNSETSNTETVGRIQKIRKQFQKRNSLPIRCSPRKKNPVKYCPPSTSRKSDASSRRNSDPSQLSELLKKKLRVAVASALEKHDINLRDPFFLPCGKRLFAICQAFVQDIPLQKGSTSQRMQTIADAHVKQVIEFERQKEARL